VANKSQRLAKSMHIDGFKAPILDIDILKYIS
jgi:hypothetical protein